MAGKVSMTTDLRKTGQEDIQNSLHKKIHGWTNRQIDRHSVGKTNKKED